MTKYRQRLPQRDGGMFLTDGGMETTSIFHDGIDLPCFASFDLINTERGRARVYNYYEQYAQIALAGKSGFVLEAPTWRANVDWGAKLGYSRQELAKANNDCIDLMVEVRNALETATSPMPISGNIGPRGDGYDPGQIMQANEAQDYHSEQIDTFRQSAADFVSAFTMNNVPEAIGVARAAQAAEILSVISFTVETDGRLPSGEPLSDAIKQVDASCTIKPVYFMINCAHPTHFENILASNDSWVQRIRGLRANSSRCSHEELDNATELDTGNPVELGKEYRSILARHPQINVLGGCCGTDHCHVEEIAKACLVEA